MKTIKTLMCILLFTLFASCVTTVPCPAYGDLNKQDINQNQTEMKITEQFIPGISKATVGDMITLVSSSKLTSLGYPLSIANSCGGMETMCTSSKKKFNHQTYYNINWSNEKLFSIVEDGIAGIERNIIGKCNLPASEDLLEQLKPGDKVLLKTYKENPFKHFYNATFCPKSVQDRLGTEITVTNLYTKGERNCLIVVDDEYNTWYMSEIANITFIQKPNGIPNKTG